MIATAYDQEKRVSPRPPKKKKENPPIAAGWLAWLQPNDDGRQWQWLLRVCKAFTGRVAGVPVARHRRPRNGTDVYVS